jgi:serine/threonine protein phosphatase PrpC/Leucine-rich repeat (LRR) protein
MGVGVSTSEEEPPQPQQLQKRSPRPNPFKTQRYANMLKRLPTTRCLNLAQMYLKEFPEELVEILEYHGEELSKISPFQIKEINFVNNLMKDFPCEPILRLYRYNLMGVTELNLNNAGLQNLESDKVEFNWGEIFSQLTRLSAHANSITKFPESLGKCRNLTEIDIRSNPCIDPQTFVPFLSDLSICEISGLKTLKLGNCFDIKYEEDVQINVPASLLELHQVSLQELLLEQNNIYSFCKDIDEPIVMMRLTDLVLFQNCLTEISEKVLCAETLPTLKNLVLISNKLECLPDSICSIVTMERLYLNQNELTCIPDNIGNLSRLIHFECSENNLNNLPESFSKLTNLTYLDITDNNVTHVHDSILENLTKVKDLMLGGNYLSEDTCSLCHIGKNMPRLYMLNIGYNEFHSIDALFESSDECLQRLDTLVVSGNLLTTLPIQISTRQCLEKLYAGNNCITDLPPGFIANLQSIQCLSLFGNKLTDSIFPDTFFSIERQCQLVATDLSHNNFAFSSPNAQSFISGLSQIDLGVEVEIQTKFNQNVEETEIEVENDESRNNGTISSGVAYMRGERPTMEDSHIINNRIETSRGFYIQLYAIFDGHSGVSTANYVAKHLSSTLIQAFNNCDTYEQYLDKSLIEHDILKTAIEKVDAQIKDNQFKDGATAIIVMVIGNRCTVANIGDSRVVLVEQKEQFIIGTRVTVDHKPTTLSERRRIKKLGGIVHEGRINGYAISRAFGDHRERPFITLEPFITHFELDPNKHKFLILACDGVWDVVSDQTAAELVNSTWNKLESESSSSQSKLSLCSAILRDYAFAIKSLDNISCIVLKFNP